MTACAAACTLRLSPPPLPHRHHPVCHRPWWLLGAAAAVAACTHTCTRLPTHSAYCRGRPSRPVVRCTVAGAPGHAVWEGTRSPQRHTPVPTPTATRSCVVWARGRRCGAHGAALPLPSVCGYAGGNTSWFGGCPGQGGFAHARVCVCTLSPPEQIPMRGRLGGGGGAGACVRWRATVPCPRSRPSTPPTPQRPAVTCGKQWVATRPCEDKGWAPGPPFDAAPRARPAPPPACAPCVCACENPRTLGHPCVWRVVRVRAAAGIDCGRQAIPPPLCRGGGCLRYVLIPRESGAATMSPATARRGGGRWCRGRGNAPRGRTRCGGGSGRW